MRLQSALASASGWPEPNSKRPWTSFTAPADVALLAARRSGKALLLAIDEARPGLSVVASRTTTAAKAKQMPEIDLVASCDLQWSSGSVSPLAQRDEVATVMGHCAVALPRHSRGPCAFLGSVKYLLPQGSGARGPYYVGWHDPRQPERRVPPVRRSECAEPGPCRGLPLPACRPRFLPVRCDDATLPLGLVIAASVSPAAPWSRCLHHSGRPRSWPR